MSEKIKPILKKLLKKEDLSFSEMEEAMQEIMAGKATPAQIGSFLTALHIKGETWQEMAACAQVLRKFALKLPVSMDDKEPLVDTCGTGGDQKGTFNVSTASAFVVAAAGVKVAKHGNRSVSSKCGSADVLEALGVKIDMPPEMAAECLEKVGMCFLFAPMYHPAMKNVMGPRKELGFRSIFNMVGPLANPAGANVQVLGVPEFAFTEKMAFALDALGCHRALVVFGEGGYDEFTITGSSKVSEVREGRITTYYVDPEDVGLECCNDPKEIMGGEAQENARMIEEILAGKDMGPRSQMVALNAGAALYAAGRSLDLKGGVKMALEMMSSGSAREKLEQMRSFSKMS